MDEYFDAFPLNPTQYYPFEYNGIFFIDKLVIEFYYSIPLHQYNNLISFYVLPADNTVDNVMDDIEDNIIAVFGEATSALYFLDGDYWTGSLMDIDMASGYWLRMTDTDTLDDFSHPINQYQSFAANNLRPYLYP
jgi:hypothetical protein